MGSPGTTQLILLLLAVATVSALSGFVVASVARRKKRRVPVYFSLGFASGLLAGAFLRRHRRVLYTLARSMRRRPLTFAVSRLPLGAWLPKR